MNPSHPNHRRIAPAAERNREPILEILRRVLPPAGIILEIASGTGQHARHFAAANPDWTWQPSDPDAGARASIAGWAAEAGLQNLRAPLALDVRQADWGIERADAIVCINMIHIAPWQAAEALFSGAARLLPVGGVLVLYGPYRREGQHTAPSNAIFDEQLRASDASWGVREMEAVIALGDSVGLRFEEAVPMPANNFSVVFRKN